MAGEGHVFLAGAGRARLPVRMYRARACLVARTHAHSWEGCAVPFRIEGGGMGERLGGAVPCDLSLPAGMASSREWGGQLELRALSQARRVL